MNRCRHIPLVIGAVLGGLVLAVGLRPAFGKDDAATPAHAPPPAKASPADLSCDAAEAPKGMACIPGGPAVIGSDEDTPAESPRHTVQLSTFFIDRREVTNAEFRACIRAGACPKREDPSRALRPFLGANLPFLPASWLGASRFCAWAGKRLPSEAEWEKAARNGATAQRFPWGDAPPSCERAHFDACKPRRTKPVGSLPAGAFGLVDMAGNGYEWVNDWATDCYGGCERACGEDCLGDDPLGPCGGGIACEGFSQRLLKGGGWQSSAEELRASWRLPAKPSGDAPRASFRCATSQTQLTRAPFWHLQKREPPASLQPPSAEQLALFLNVRDDTNVLTIPECENQGEASHDCRDPMSYIKSNEGLRRLFSPYIENLGGGYVGIGSDQGYDFISEARSEWAWLFDYDPEVVRVHQVLRAVILNARDPESFLDAFLPENIGRTKRWVRRSLRDRPKEIQPTLATLARNRELLHEHYLDSSEVRPAFGSFGWLANPGHYRYIRQMYRQGRIQIRKGNLLTDVVMPEIASSARALGVPIRIFYASNADDQWDLTERYRQNQIGLPIDERSVVLRTILGRHLDGFGDEWAKWVFVVHGAEHLHRTLQRNHTRLTADLMVEALPTHNERLYTIGLPGRESLRAEAPHPGPGG